jgi:hypothetical protein
MFSDKLVGRARSNDGGSVGEHFGETMCEQKVGVVAAHEPGLAPGCLDSPDQRYAGIGVAFMHRAG